MDNENNIVDNPESHEADIENLVNDTLSKSDDSPVIENIPVVDEVPVVEPDDHLPKRVCACGYIGANTFCPECGKSMARAPLVGEPKKEEKPQGNAFVCACGRINSTAECSECGDVSVVQIAISDSELLALKRGRSDYKPTQKREKPRLYKVSAAYIVGAMVYIASMLILFLRIVDTLVETFIDSISYFRFLSDLGGIPYWEEGGDEFFAIITVFVICWTFIVFFLLGFSRVMSSLSVKKYTQRLLYERRSYGVPSIVCSIIFLVLSTIAVQLILRYESWTVFGTLLDLLIFMSYAIIASVIGGILMIVGFENGIAHVHNRRS